MFDFGFSELMVIGAVALVVLGPERLPMVARTAGEWLGKDELSASFDKAAKEGFGEKPALEAADKASDIVGDTGTVDTTSTDTSSAVDDFYGWYGNQNNYVDEDDNSKVFEKRYKSGPSIDDLAEQIERLKAELGDRSPQLGGNNRRYAMRARSNRVRIYR